MSAENRDVGDAASQRHQRKRNNKDNQERNKGFSLQAKHPSSEEPDGADAVSLDVGPTEKPRLVVIKNEEEIVRPSTSPDSPSSEHDHHHNNNNNTPREGMREMCGGLKISPIRMKRDMSVNIEIK